MSNEWNYYLTQVDGVIASIMVDLGIARDLPRKQFPNLGFLRLRMKNPQPDGLSSQEDYDVLMVIEDALTNTICNQRKIPICGRQKAVFVGRNTCDGYRDFYFYTNKAALEADFARIMLKWPDYDYETGLRPDPEWAVYKDFLYPSEEDFQRMGNRDVIEKLIENGDKIEVAREIDHFSYFKTEMDKASFVHYLKDNGFSISPRSESADNPLAVSFQRVDPPVNMDNVTIDLFRAAKKFNGDYDGWGCVCVVDAESPD